MNFNAILILVSLLLFSAPYAMAKNFLDCDFNNPAKLLSTKKTNKDVIYENYLAPFIVLEESTTETGNNVVRLTRQHTKKGALCSIKRNISIPDNCNYEVSIRVNLETKGAFALWFCDYEKKCIGGLWLRANRILAAYNEKQVWVPSGITKTPKNKWFDLLVKFDVVKKKYQITLIIDKVKKSNSRWMPFLSQKAFQGVTSISSPPKGTSVLFDDLKVTYTSERVIKNRLDALEGADISVTINNKKTSVPMLLDGSIRANALLKMPAVLNIDLAKPVQVSTLRLYDGAPEYHQYPSGHCRASSYIVEGLNDAGQWRKLASLKKGSKILNIGNDPETMYQQKDFPPIVISKLKITINDSSDTLKRSSGTSKVKTVILREIVLLGKELAAQSNLNNRFRKNIYGEFRLPVYQQQSVANLYIYNIRKDKKNHKVKIELRERYSKKLVQKERIIMLKPGENIIEIKLDKLSDGEYATAIIDQNDPQKRSGKFRRLLRLQRLDAKSNYISTASQMTGKKMFFPDAHYLEKYSNIKFSGAQAKMKQIVKPNSVSEGFIRMGTDLFFDKSGNLNLKFITLNRFWKQKPTKTFLAVQSKDDKSNWKILKYAAPYPAKVKHKSPLESLPPIAAKADCSPKYKNGIPPKFQFYNAKIHGPVKLNQVQLKYVTKQDMTTVFGQKHLDWKIIDPPPFSTWPIWHKAPGTSIILTKSPLFIDGLAYGEFEDKIDSNDNIVGQWLSDDGKTLYYGRACKLKRFPPFTAKYDNIHYCSRIIKIISTKDGINWKYSYMVPPVSSDPLVTQHYGARVYRVPEGNGLKQAFVYLYKSKSQQISVEIAYSWDGGNWYRYPKQPAFLENGKPGSWNGGMIFISRDAVARDGVVYQMMQWVLNGYHFYGDFYYFRANMNTVTGPVVKKYFAGRNLENWPFFKHFGGYDGIAADIRKAGVSVGIASYRLGGLFFISVQGAKVGSFISRPITASNGMTANVSIAKGGFLAINLIDKAGKEIPGYTKRLSPSDNIVMPIFKQLPKVPFRIRVKLKNTKLFSLNF